MRTRSVILILLVFALSGMAVEEGFKPYQIIIDKHPFGEEPLEAETVQIPYNQSFARHLRLSVLYEGPNGDLRAGIIDASTKKSYILNIGEIEDGLELVEVDLEASEAMLRKGKEVALFKLKGAPEQLTPKQLKDRKSSYPDRRKSRQTAATPAKPAAPRLTGEALKQHLENVQMDAIRTGKPPLPLPLTPEMDAQLVSEGVLDPQ